MDEMQEPPILTPEQEQRATAVMTAGKVLRASTGIASGKPGDIADIVDLAHYIATGDTYSVMVAHREREDNPLVGLLIGMGYDPPTEDPGKAVDEDDAPPFD